jgi:hypothetical protein
VLEQLFIHIGMSRTATTLHQQRVFAKHSGIAYIGKPAADDEIARLSWTLSRGHERFFDPAATADAFAKLHAARGSHLPLLLSDEAFWGPGAWPLGAICERFRQIARQPRVIMTLRRQDDLIRSLVLLDIIDPFRVITASKLYRYEHSLYYCRSTYMGNLFYDGDLEIVRKAIGGENVLVLLYEELVREPKRYVERLARFVGADAEEMWRLFEAAGRGVNTGASLDEASFISFRVKTFRVGRKRKLDWLGGNIVRALGIKGDAHKTAERIERDAREIYAESNRGLARIVDYDLAAYGYPI